MIIRNINTNQMHQEDLQKTTRLTAETIPAVKLIIVIFKVFMHGIANSPCGIFIENVFNFFIKLEKLVELVIEFQITHKPSRKRLIKKHNLALKIY